jgi:hypothetical protein
LITLDPYGDRWIDIPSPEELAALFQVDKRTIQSAAQRIMDANLFDFEVKRWKGKNNRPLQRSADFSTEKRLPFVQKRSKLHKKDPNCKLWKTPESHTGQGIQAISDCTNNRINRSIQKQKRTEQPGPTHHPVPDKIVWGEINRKEPGMELETPETLHKQLCNQIDRSGIRPNKAIQNTLWYLLNSPEAPAARQIVQNALSSYYEKRESIRNPAGFLNAAIQRRFTANGSKCNSQKDFSHSPPRDLSDTFVAIDLELARLGWSRDQALEWMATTHHWRRVAFHALADPELDILLATLKATA